MTVALQFDFEFVRAELLALKKITNRFMADRSIPVFEQLEATLEQIRSTGQVGRWGPTHSDPLQTIASTTWEKGGKAAFSIIGQMSWTWEITPIRSEKKRTLANRFALSGVSSAAASIRRQQDDFELVRWTSDIGSTDSPGCYFHTHIHSEICIPRMPSIFVTPMTALEFLLGEVFQDKWEEFAVSDRDDVKVWRSSQLKLLSRVLEWKKKQIQNGSGSPWVALKRSKPTEMDNLFLV